MHADNSDLNRNINEWSIWVLNNNVTICIPLIAMHLNGNSNKWSKEILTNDIYKEIVTSDIDIKKY